MNLREKLMEAHRSDDWAEIYRLMDECSSDEPKMRRRIARWRSRAPIGEGRYQEAVDLVREHKSEHSFEPRLAGELTRKRRESVFSSFIIGRRPKGFRL
jgi:hypothetical protein